MPRKAQAVPLDWVPEFRKGFEKANKLLS